MVGIAKEMKRQKMEVPLLIGGATTSLKHTAVKIAPKYNEPIIRVRDASKVAQVVGNLLNEDKKIEFSNENRKKTRETKKEF